MSPADDLNPEQQAAVAIVDGPLCVIAGAGSGKTRVITHRIANLVARGVDARKILGVTFTNKAAREMHERVASLVGAGGPTVTTFHSLAVRILRYDAEKIGRARDFTIYDRDESLDVMRQAAEQAGLPDDFASPYALLEYVSAQRNSRPGVSVAWPGRVWRTFEDDLVKTRARYEAILVESNALDFDELLIQSARLLQQSAEALDGWRGRFSHVLVDEFQDTNWHQYQLAKLLTEASRNLCVTGDPDQSIYTWRGADPRNFEDFRADYPEAVEIVLAQNYRSTGAILRAASNVMAPAPGRLHKNLWSALGDGEPVTGLRFTSDREEASHIARAVRDWVRTEDFAYRDVALLFRVNALTLPFEREMLSHGIPFRVVGGPSFFLRSEVKDLVAYLRMLANPRDTLALLRVINVPPRGIGDKTLTTLVAHAAAEQVPLREMIARRDWGPLGKKPSEALDRFADLLVTLSDVPTAPVRRLLEAIIGETQYATWWKDRAAHTPGMDPLRNIEQLVSFAGDFDRDRQDALGQFLEQSALLTDQDRDSWGDDRVTLLTVHAAKGLEFDAVVLVGLEDDLFPHANSSDDAHGVEEERRLLHVALTRARRRLVLTYADNRSRYGTSRTPTPSRFLRDLGPDVQWRGGGSLSGHALDLGRQVEFEDDPDDPLLRMRKGTVVRHPDYGLGRVRDIRSRQRGLDATVALEFEGGVVRAFIIRSAGLTVVDQAGDDW